MLRDFPHSHIRYSPLSKGLKIKRMMLPHYLKEVNYDFDRLRHFTAFNLLILSFLVIDISNAIYDIDIDESSTRICFFT